MKTPSMEFQPSVDVLEEDLKRKEIQLNQHIDEKILKNPNKMPTAIYFIIPNEFAERFCYYGINPLINPLFKSFLNMGPESAFIHTHVFKALAYFTPLIGAALSDSFLGKYETIVYLSSVYVVGTALLAGFTSPHTLAYGGVLIGMILMAIGTGGIKPCVSAHGGDQFLEVQKNELNKFYNYFYWAINAGALISNFVVPVIQEQNCFGSRGDCYAWAIACCSIIIGLATLVFVLGKRTYRIVPPAKVFLPWKIVQVLIYCFKEKTKDLTKNKTNGKKALLEYAVGKFHPDLIDEVRDVSTMFWVLLPAPVFWMAFDQYSTTWQNQYTQMNPMWGSFKFTEAMSTTWNAFFIIALIPVFSEYMYPFIERRFGRFRLLDRMLAGMIIAAVAFISCALIQYAIDSNPAALVYDKESHSMICNPNDYSKCVHGAWQIIPYLVITIGELLFSVSGLNFTYEEVGKKMKASAANLWLLMVAVGNLLDVVLAPAYSNLGPFKFFLLNSGIILAFSLLYVFIRRIYVYREDRQSVI